MLDAYIILRISVILQVFPTIEKLYRLANMTLIELRFSFKQGGTFAIHCDEFAESSDCVVWHDIAVVHSMADEWIPAFKGMTFPCLGVCPREKEKTLGENDA